MFFSAHFSRGEDEFAICLEKVRDNVSAFFSNRQRMPKHEQTAWKISSNLQRDKHPLLLVQKEKRERKLQRLFAASTDKKQETISTIRAPVPNAVHISFLESRAECWAQMTYRSRCLQWLKLLWAIMASQRDRLSTEISWKFQFSVNTFAWSINDEKSQTGHWMNVVVARIRKNDLAFLRTHNSVPPSRQTEKRATETVAATYGLRLFTQ